MVCLLAAAGAAASGKVDTGATPANPTAPAAGSYDPFGKMPQLVVFTTARETFEDPKIPPGEDLINNDLVKYVEKTINVRPNIIWTTSSQNYAFEAKINLLIASRDIPDVLEFRTAPYGMAILKKLVANDMIQDLTQVVQNYASASWKDHHAAAGNVAIKLVTFNGKLMAMPNLSDTESAWQFVWMRKDWLDKLGLKPPTTVDDVAAIAKAFIQRDPDGNGVADTYGIPGSSELYRGATNTFEWVFNAHKAFPGDWIKDASGKVVYGSILPETRAALAKLQQLYRDGLIDREFALKDASKSNEPLIAGKEGIHPNAWWATWWPLNTAEQNDWNAQWYAYGIRAVDGNYWARATLPASQVLVIRKGFKYPEAIVKANNIPQDAELSLYPWYNELRAPGAKYGALAQSLWPVSTGSKYYDEISRRWKIVKDAFDTGKDPKTLDPQSQGIYLNMKPDRDNPEKHLLDSWTYNVAWSRGADVLLQHSYKMSVPAFAGTTDSMTKKWTPMNDLETDVFTKIIMDKLPITAFDDFVKQWKSMGGDDITKEVNDLVQ
jgi:putative aldouronate transport system substrate-binding protein